MDRTVKEPVRLREKKLASGGASLYLDFYVNGRRSYEFLKLYLVPEKSRADKERNRQTLQLANAIKAKRIVEAQSNAHGFAPSRDASKVRFFDFFRSRCEDERKEGSRGSYDHWMSCLRHLEVYERDDSVTFAKITPDWVRKFREYLDKKAVTWSRYGVERRGSKHLSETTKLGYFNKLKTALGIAVKRHIIPANPADEVEGFRRRDSARMYLTQDEVRRLAATPCPNDTVRRAFLFSCLTGLRRSDVERLRWEDVHDQDGLVRLIFAQKKTGGQEYLDIAAQAATLMGERSVGPVFPGLVSPARTNLILRRWVARAGIRKHISFHCARHTFATLMLDIGTDIYTVSKLLGHRELTTTQVYAKILDRAKQEAVAGIPDLLK
ncbi:MAG: site-specific integrase [Paludibacteraceae bacterium]|nr:site-specific integrase [Paludibacteraceae bacterium]